MIPDIGHSLARSRSNLENQVSSQSPEEPGYLSLPFEIYQDPSAHRQAQDLFQVRQIPVLPTPSSFGEENFFPDSDPPSYESVMASGGGGPDLEQRRLGDKMMILLWPNYSFVSIT